MSDTDTSPDTPGVDAPDTDTTETDTWTPPDKNAWDKLSADAKRRDELLRKAQAEIAELKRGQTPDTPDKPAEQGEPAPDSDTDKLRTALRRTAASAVLSGRGITDESEVATVLSVVHLDTLPIGGDGTVDTSTLADTLDTLAKVFGRTPDKRPDTSRVDSRRGSGDPGTARSRDSERYKRIIGRGR